jgi:signal peptidase I
MAAWVWLVAAIAARAYLVFALALALCALIPLLWGLSGSVVQSGSMEPHISAGDVVLSRPSAVTDSSPLGHVVTFHADSRADVILHRIVGINSDGSFVTAGDSNRDVDSAALPADAILGRAVLLVPLIGLPVFWITTGQVLPALAWAAVTLLALLIEASSSFWEGRSPQAPQAKTRGVGGVIRGHGVGVIPVASVVVVALVMLSVAGRPVTAAFSAQTTNVGNSWTTAIGVPPSKLVFSTSPNSSTGGVAFSRQPVVRVQNASGGTYTGTRTVTLSITTPAGAVLRCAATSITSNTGVISFSGCAIDRVGTYTLTASSGALTPAVSQSFTVRTGPAAALRFTAEPGTTVPTVAFATQPRVAIVDAGGNATTSSARVTLSLTTPGNAALRCSVNPRAASSGVAVFANCSVDRVGTYTLTATSPGLVAAVTASFVIVGDPIPALTCQSQIWMATFSWSPATFVPTVYHLYVNGIQAPATGADGWNPYVQLTSNNIPVGQFPAGTGTVEVRQVLADGTEKVVGRGTVILGTAGQRTYTCG